MPTKDRIGANERRRARHRQQSVVVHFDHSLLSCDCPSTHTHGYVDCVTVERINREGTSQKGTSCYRCLACGTMTTVVHNRATGDYNP